MRSILREQYGVDLGKVQWVTFEDPHLAEYTDPAFVERAPAGKNLVQMLLDGEVDAAVVGDKLPDPRLNIADPGSARRRRRPGPRSTARRSIICSSSGVNCRKSVPDVVREVFRIFKEAPRYCRASNGNKNAAQLTFGLEPNRAALETIINSAFEQKLLPRRYSVDELFDDTTRNLA